MVGKKGFVKVAFSYKNCFDGHTLVFPDRSPDEILEFNVGEELPQVLVDRLFIFNPEHLAFEKPIVDVKAEVEEEALEPKFVDKEFTGSQLIEMNKDEQIDILRTRGIENIGKLKTEKERVAKIIETNPGADK